jgi:hypothetical protein
MPPPHNARPMPFAVVLMPSCCFSSLCISLKPMLSLSCTVEEIGSLLFPPSIKKQLNWIQGCVLRRFDTLGRSYAICVLRLRAKVTEGVELCKPLSDKVIRQMHVKDKKDKNLLFINRNIDNMQILKTVGVYPNILRWTPIHQSKQIN